MNCFAFRGEIAEVEWRTVTGELSDESWLEEPLMDILLRVVNTGAISMHTLSDLSKHANLLLCGGYLLCYRSIFYSKAIEDRELRPITHWQKFSAML